MTSSPRIEKPRPQETASPQAQPLYSVWVGGVEVNSELLTHQEARKLANYYEQTTYEDVQIEFVKRGFK